MNLIFLSIPGLRVRDIQKETTPTLFAWANAGVLAELVPTFPCVTSPVQANMLTGVSPAQHGVIANGFYHRDRHEAEFWVGHNLVIQAPQVWDVLKARRPGATTAVWHAQNIKGAAADFIVTPAPIHEPDGTTKLWCYSKPDGLYRELLDLFGHFPLQHYWGPLANIESTKWILRAAAWLHERHAPDFHYVYVPHLDYAAQKFGPNSPEAQRSLAELDQQLAVFAAQIAAAPGGEQAVYLVAGEYALTDVTGVVYPNRILREAGLVNVCVQDGAEYLNLPACAAFAMVDHQFAHVYVRDADDAAVRRVVELFRSFPGVAEVAAGADRERLGMDHERSGEIILVAEDTHWFAYYWWLEDRLAPPFARTVDIHRKPGYDPVELFFDPATKGIPLNAALVKGSHGVPATRPEHRTALLCSTTTDRIRAGRVYRDTDVFSVIVG